MVIETCPKCGGELDILTLTINPPISARRCRRCGWYWQGKMSQTVRVPFQLPEEETSKWKEKIVEEVKKA